MNDLTLRPVLYKGSNSVVAFCLFFFLFLIMDVRAAQTVPDQSVMSDIYDQVKTPYKYGLVLAPSSNNYKIDCPTVFREGNKWFMTYLVYNGKTGTDGRGYETWLAESDNLLEWKTKGRILSFRDGKWDQSQRGGYPALPEMEWGGNYKLKSFKNKYWLTYIGGANSGYEAGPLKIGLAWTPKGKLTAAEEWQAFDKPLLSPDDKDAQWFENITQYKSVIYQDDDRKLGAKFVMFYNAGGINPENKTKAERIGIALSNDLKKWKRYPGNPVFTHEEGITGDAHIQKIGDVYVMFYFSAFRKDRNYKAFNTFACSYDLVHWTDWKGDDLIIPSRSYDDLFAHKSYVIYHNGVVYHFYCAVNKFDQRGIAVATSKPMGKSAVNFPAPEVKEKRTQISLNDHWQVIHQQDTFRVNVPHNLDDYYGYRNLTHGNLHGKATYSKKFMTPDAGPGKSYFLRFEGVGTYAHVWLNGKDLGRHPAGRTTLTLSVDGIIIPGKENKLVVMANHPEMITDMPWVCGGCSSEWGFSEGSQPFGIFRPVTLEITDVVRIEPFGVHVWHNDKMDSVFIDTEVKNYGNQDVTVELVSKLNNADGIAVFRLPQKISLRAGEMKVFRQSAAVVNPNLWSLEKPYLYHLTSMIKKENITSDEISTAFGFRTISWPVKRKDGDGRFFLNGKPVFINGVCEYEHQFGQSHAFSHEQIIARMKQIRNAGFNAFRDAHQPHHLLYGKLMEEQGMLWWTQMSAHIWYDTPAFRENFKNLLRQWVKERRNSPAVVMWGLQNESSLPKAFAEECSAIIREMDPTARTMRVISTCNGGDGTDWNVVQNWSGTYNSGVIENYHRELARPDQLLNGEYGAWRTLDLHTEPEPFNEKGKWSEDRMCRLMEMKVRLAEQAKDSVCGQFQWIFSSHDNPGRKQPDEAYRLIDKVGPFNYKGLTTPWEEPLDVYYMYRSNYVPASKDPMVYLVSHTWPYRFDARRRADVEVYSNCDSVKLYNDVSGNIYLGKKKKNGVGTHMMWENRDIRYNVLKAVGYYQGKPVAEDLIILNNLEKAPDFESLHQGATDMLKVHPDFHYLYRINCGGDAYTDEFGQQWLKDDSTFSTSWGSGFKDLNPYLASQRVSYDPVKGVKDWSLFGHFRFGRHALKYRFPLPDGKYRVELYFVEPWHGTGGSSKTDCEGLRIFDVAVNDSVVINDLDIWAEAGHDAALKKVIYADVKNGELNISFPEVKAGQAVISAIAIAASQQVEVPVIKQSDWSWQEANQEVFEKMPKEFLPEDKNARPATVYPAEKAVIQGNSVVKLHRNKTGVFFDEGKTGTIAWNISTGLAQVYALRFHYMNLTGKAVEARLMLLSANGSVLKDEPISLPETAEKWKLISTTTGEYINAGHYQVKLLIPNPEGISLQALDIQ